MLQPPSDRSDASRAYQQALDDFGIAQLLSAIRNYSDADFDADREHLNQEQLESLAVFLIQRVAVNLKGSAIARDLHTLRKASSQIVAELPGLELNSNLRGKTPEYLVGSDRTPWAIVRILPNAQHCTVARFVNRQDAEDHLRALSRFIPVATFEIVCDRLYLN